MTPAKTFSPSITDAELGALVAEHVAGWRKSRVRPDWPPHPYYATSADAVLPLLEKAYPASSIEDRSFTVEVEYLPKHERTCKGYEWAYCVQIFPKHAGVSCGTAGTLPRAACFALLSAHGFTVADAAGNGREG